MTNKHSNTVSGFGDEWHRYDQSALSDEEREKLFARYFDIFPWHLLPANAVGFDMGCGSGRWAKLVAPRVGKLYCIDPSSALEIAKSNLKNIPNCEFIEGGVGDNLLPSETMDFGYSLGVLHHVPDTRGAIAECIRSLKPGAPFLIYLYYRFDNRSAAFRAVWRVSEIIRFGVSRLPHSLRYLVANILALAVYLPLARFARLLEKCGVSQTAVDRIPLSSYRTLSYYTMRTDALDRFGTQLEQRFTKEEIRAMLSDGGLERVEFSENTPFWCAVGYKKSPLVRNALAPSTV